MNDLKGTKLKVFSILQKCNEFYSKEKDIDLDEYVSELWLERSPKFIKDQCKRIWNEIENGFYEYDELKIYALYTLLFTSKRVSLQKVTRKNVSEVMSLFTKKQYKRDQQFIIDVNQKVQLDGIENYFIINSNGRNVIYTLIFKQFVSPYFYIKLKKFVPKKNIFKKSKELVKFEFVVNKIEKLLDKMRTKNYINNTLSDGRCSMA